jgi:hypothetical protein
MALFAPDNGVNPHARYPDTYYRNIWLNKQMFDGVELVGKIEKISKKQAAHLLIEAGFKYYIGEKIKEDIRNRLAAKELNRKVKLTRFVLEFRRFAKERGMDISKII